MSSLFKTPLIYNNQEYKSEPIAIIGMSCRFPGGVNSPEEFWELLINKKDAITDIPADRWDKDSFYHPDTSVRGKMNVTQGGFLENIDQFDAELFEISPNEARHIDPQQRLLLEVTYHAMEDAGLTLQNLSGSKTGVFIGISSHDYSDLTSTFTEQALISNFTNTGNSNCIASNRISYCFNLKGPSFSVDTACSSSLYAVHYAVHSLRKKEAAMAIVGAVNLIIKPELHIGFSKAGFLSSYCRCKAFDESANGYVRSEGAGVVILKPLSQALKDRDSIYATIIGSAVNQDGRTTGISMPNIDSQMEMLKAAYENSGIDPHAINYVEAHGTGTAVGDVVEATAIGQILGKNRENSNPLYVGSVKTNIGHLEAASGMAGLIKLILSFKNRQIPANLHLKIPNPKIPFSEYNIVLPQNTVSFNKNENMKYASINSFGFGGSNAHVILESPPDLEKAHGIHHTPEIQSVTHPLLFSVSAKNKPALIELIKIYIDYLNTTKDSLTDICYSTDKHRSIHDLSLVISAYSKQELAEKLKNYLDDENTLDKKLEQVRLKNKLYTIFVYSGQGPQWWAMGQELYKQEPVFAKNIKEIDKTLTDLGWLQEEKSSLVYELNKDESTSCINETHIAQPAIFAIQVALTRLWQHYSVEPDAVIGHSIGEIAAAYFAGIISLEQAVKIVYWRSLCQRQFKNTGSMLAVGLKQEEVRRDLLEFDLEYEKNIAIAVQNGPQNVTLSGNSDALEQFAARLNDKNIFNRFLRINIPFHSPILEPLKDQFLESLGKMEPGKNIIPFYSAVSGAEIKSELITSDYWYANIRRPVLFYQAISEAIRNDCNIFVEISPHPILSKAIKDTLEENKKTGLIVPSLRRYAPEYQTFMDSFAEIERTGYPVNWEKCFQYQAKRVKLPHYVMHKDSYWVETEKLKNERTGKLIHPHLKEKHEFAKEKNTVIWDIVLDKNVTPYINDHRVQGPIVYPAAGQIELVHAAALESFGNEYSFIEKMEFLTPLFLSEEGELPQIQLEILGNEGDFHISSRVKDGDWIIHSSGKLNLMGDEFNQEIPNLIEIKSKMTDVIDLSNFYKSLNKKGLKYGNSFQCLNKAYLNNDYIFTEIDLTREYSRENFQIHPIIIDVSFQSIFILLHNSNKFSIENSGIYIPIDIKNIKFNKLTGDDKYYCIIKPLNKDNNQIINQIWVFDRLGNILFEINKIICKKIDKFQNENEEFYTKYLYDYKWILQNNITQKNEYRLLTNTETIKNKINNYYKKWQNDKKNIKFLENFIPKINELSIKFIIQALINLEIPISLNQKFNIHDLIKSIKIPSRHYRLFTRLFQILECSGYVKKSTNNEWLVTKSTNGLLYNENTIRALINEFPEFYLEINLIKKCGILLDKVIIGEIDPISILFSEENWDTIVDFYTNSYSFIPYYNLTKNIIDEIVKKNKIGKQLNILEIGAGTGGMTKIILPLLPEKNTNFYFTDISNVFLLKAQQRFNNYSFITYKTLDIEKDTLEQGFIAQSFDIIIASNVIHATKDINKTIQKIKKLLVSNGVLLFLEITNPPISLDLIFGMTRGWWIFEDNKLRTDKAILSNSQWDKVLKANQFSDFSIFPNYENELQSLILAINTKNKNSEILNYKTLKNDLIVIFEDNINISERLYIHFEKQKIKYIIVKKGDNFTKLNDGNFIIDPTNSDNIVRLLKTEIIQKNKNNLKFIYLWSVNAKKNTQITFDIILKSQKLNTFVFINIIKIIINQNLTPKFWLITNGTKSFNKSKNSIIGESVWGISRVISNEYPMMSISAVDISRNPNENDINELFYEIFSSKEIDEIIIRGKKKYYAKLTHFENNDLKKLFLKKILNNDLNFHLSIKTPGIIDNLYLKESERILPENNEVEIEVKAAGLNFRDIMLSMGYLHNDAIEGGLCGNKYGLECSGIVTNLGKNVKNFKNGDKVIALSANSISRYTVANSDHIVNKPQHLSYEEAASIPAVYLTAYYTLYNICQIKKKNTILIHSAAGGVGIAVIRIAQMNGLTIFTTAGNEKKREFLKKMGIKHIFNSRSLDFKNKILKLTNGIGVDIIINTIAGKTLLQNFRCLAPFGKYIEIGKRDIFENTKIGLKQLSDNISYFVVDIDKLLKYKPIICKNALNEIMTLFEKKKLIVHPFKPFPIAKYTDAFSYLVQSKHIGKVIISMKNLKNINIVTNRQIKFKINGTYLVVGGSQGLGLRTVEWLAINNVKNIIIMCRNDINNEESRNIIEKLKNSGVNISVLKGDVGEYDDVFNVIKNIKNKFQPLKGIIHAAAVFDDAPITKLTFDQYMNVFKPKALGMWNLHCATKDIPLDFFIAYSSFSSIFGQAGQTNYAAANAFLNSFAFYRYSMGLPCTSINWGVIKDTGYLTRNKKVYNILKGQGWNGLSYKEAFSILKDTIVQNPIQRIMINPNWNNIYNFFPKAKLSYRFKHFENLNLEANQNFGDKNLIELVTKQDKNIRHSFLSNILTDAIAKIVGTPKDLINKDLSINKLGIDSLMSSQIINWIQRNFKFEISLMKIMQGPTINDLAFFILDNVFANSKTHDILSHNNTKIQRTEKWILKIKENSKAKIRLFCFPYLGAGASVFSLFKNYDKNLFEIYAIQYPGRENRNNEEPINDILTFFNELSKIIMLYDDKPFAFYGHSFGSYICFGLSKYLHDNSKKLPVYLFLSSSAGPLLENPIQILFDNTSIPEIISVEIIIKLIKKFNIPVSQLDDKILTKLQPVFKNDINFFKQIINTNNLKKIPCPIHTFNGKDDNIITEKYILLWKDFTSNNFGNETVPGNHIFINNDESTNKILNSIHNCLEKEIFSEKLALQ